VGLTESLQQIDIDIFRTLNLAGSNDLLDAVMVAFTLLGISYVIILLAIPLWLKGKREEAFDLIILVVIVTFATEAIKVLIARQRPSLELTGVHTILSASGPSFPSAHASRAFAVALLISLNVKRPWAVAAFVVAILIAISRVFLGLHWPSDVFFGALLGLLLAATMRYFERRSRSYRVFRESIIGLLNAVALRCHASKRSANDKAVET
jgi:undecaprenyl-diphosphatase